MIASPTSTHAVVPDALEQLEHFVETATWRKRVEVLADVRLENIEMTIDQLGRAERDFVGELDAAAVPSTACRSNVILPVTSPSGF